MFVWLLMKHITYFFIHLNNLYGFLNSQIFPNPIFFLLCVHLLLIKIYLTKKCLNRYFYTHYSKKNTTSRVSYAPSLSCQIWRNIYC